MILDKGFLMVCAFIIMTIACGPRNVSLAQDILGEWTIVPLNKENRANLNWIKFHTDKTFDAIVNNDKEVKGDWSTSDITHSLMIKIQNYPLLNGEWGINLQKKTLVLTSKDLSEKMSLSKN